MQFVYILTAVILLLSFLKDKKKTSKSLKVAFTKFKKILPAFLGMMILISIALYLIPQDLILKILGNGNKFFGTFLASILGSITLMPGFIAYPLAGILRQQGVSYMVLSAFTTTLMLVGILTFPVEKTFLGTKVTIIRNLICFMIAIIVAFATGILFGELGI